MAVPSLAHCLEKHAANVGSQLSWLATDFCVSGANDRVGAVLFFEIGKHVRRCFQGVRCSVT